MRIQVYQSPDVYRFTNYNKNLFLAGGITNCPNWQEDAIKIFKENVKDGLNIFNPRRRETIDSSDRVEVKKQIEWEIKYLDNKNEYVHYMFWFPKETLCPITLFELGKLATNLKWLEDNALANGYMFDALKWITIGMHPDYARRFDLEVQIPHILDDIVFHYNLEDTVNNVVEKLELERKVK